MGFRFRRSIKLLPGIRVNLSKSGVSTSIGTRGATINIKGDRVRTTVGIPGTGLSYSEQRRIGAPRADREQPVMPNSAGSSRVLFWLVVLAVVAVAFAFFQ